MSNSQPSTLNGSKDLRTRFAEWIAKHPPVDGKPFSKADAGTAIGYSVTMVSRYLNGKLDSDTTKLESVIEDVIKTDLVLKSAEKLFDTNVTDLVNATLEDIRKKHVCGVISGPAGSGKTSGITLFQTLYPSAICVTATKWKCSSRGAGDLVFEQLETRGYNKREISKWDFAAGKLTDSDRLIVWDNAHRLQTGAFDAIFDFHDKTGVGMAFVGNPEILETISRNDQHFSRCAIKVHVRLDLKKVKGISDTMAHRVFNSSADDELIELVEQVVSNHGHLRAVKHQLNLAADIAGKTKLSPADAFRAAHEQLFREYKLD